MKKLDKLANEVMAQSINEPSLFDNFSIGFQNSLRKLGTFAVFGVLTLGVVGMATEAQAMDNQSFGVATGISGLLGMATNGSVPNNLPPECAHIQGKNGWAVTGGGTAGALLGSNIGKGNGSKWATVAGTVLGVGIANGSEEQRIQRECAAIVARNQQQNMQQQQYMQQNTPNYNQNSATPTADILYQANPSSGQSFFVTLDNSPGLLSITGNRQGVIDPQTSPVVFNGVQKSLDNLRIAHINLDNVAKKYLRIVNRSEEEIFNPNPSSNTPRNNNMVSQTIAEYDQAYNAYAAKRGIAASILDEASARNYNLNGFSGSISFFQVPQSAKVTYSTAFQKPFENRYANDIKTNGMR